MVRKFSFVSIAEKEMGSENGASFDHIEIAREDIDLLLLFVLNKHEIL